MGGEGFSAVIAYEGRTDSITLDWFIDLDTLFGLIFFRPAGGTINICSGEEVTISTNGIFGLGQGMFTVDVDGSRVRGINAFVIGPYVFLTS